jgi:chromosome partitioning protein
MGIQAKILGGKKPEIGLAADGWDLGGEHPSVVLHDIASRPRQNGHLIVFANEKGGVGKSTLAFHAAIALSDAGNKVACIDLDYAQATLSRALTNREATCRLLKTWLPTPRHVALTHPSGGYLWQEIARIGSDCDYVVLDVAGSDSPIARRAIAMADTLVTPVNCSFADLDLLGQFDAHSLRLIRLGHFTRLVQALGEARKALRMPAPDWVVMPNRYRRAGSNNEALAKDALCGLADIAGFRLGHGLGERVAFRELFLFGLTHIDLKRIPKLARVKAFARREIEQLLIDLRLPQDDGCQPSLFPLNDNPEVAAGGEVIALPA